MFRRLKPMPVLHALVAVLLGVAALLGAWALPQAQAAQNFPPPQLELTAQPTTIVVGFPATMVLRLTPAQREDLTFSYQVTSGAEWVEQPGGTVTLPANSSEVQFVLRTKRPLPVPPGTAFVVQVRYGDSQFMARAAVNLIDFAEIITDQQTGGERFGTGWTARCEEDPYQSLCPRAGLPRPDDVAPALGSDQTRFQGLPGCVDGRGFDCPPPRPPPGTSIWLKIAALAAALAVLWTDFLVFVRVQPHVLGISAEGMSFVVGDVAAPDVMPQIIAEPGDAEFNGPVEAHFIEPGEEGTHGLRV